MKQKDKSTRKISPEDYRTILGLLELDDIFINSYSAKLNKDSVSKCLSFKISESSKFEQKNNDLNIDYTFKFVAKDTDNNEIALTINTTYSILYKIKNEGIIITEDFMEVFRQVSLGMLLWPYFREFVNNTIYRMGMPQLVLPLKKIGTK